MLIELGQSALLGNVNYFTVGISIFTIILIYCSKEYLNPILKKKVKKIPIPYDLIVVSLNFSITIFSDDIRRYYIILVQASLKIRNKNYRRNPHRGRKYMLLLIKKI